METDPEGVSAVELDCLSARAAAAHPDQDLDGVLQEARQIRLEIQQIQQIQQMASYNDAEVSHREACERHIRTQIVH